MNKSFVFLIAVGLLACRSEQNSTEVRDSSGVSVVDSPLVNNNLLFEDQNLSLIFNDYISLKDKLVATNFDAAKTQAQNLANSLKGYEGCENAEKIAVNMINAKDIAQQRNEFLALNVELIPLIKQAKLKSGTIYLQHCPMANKGEGGDWLSSAEKIQNPYYGDEMMECGLVAEEIK